MGPNVSLKGQFAHMQDLYIQNLHYFLVVCSQNFLLLPKLQGTSYISQSNIVQTSLGASIVHTDLVGMLNHTWHIKVDYYRMDILKSAVSTKYNWYPTINLFESRREGLQDPWHAQEWKDLYTYLPKYVRSMNITWDDHTYS